VLIPGWRAVQIWRLFHARQNEQFPALELLRTSQPPEPTPDWSTGRQPLAAGGRRHESGSKQLVGTVIAREQEQAWKPYMLSDNAPG
jgi:hypothetical protein